MAKTKNATKEFTFEDLNSELLKVAPLGSTMDISTFSEIDEYIDIGSHVLNLCMTGSVFGGIPNNRAVELMGPSGVGKTFVMLCAARNAQKMGYYIYWYDSENAVDKKLMEGFGIDTSKVWYEPCNTVETFRTSVTNLTGKLIEAKRSGLGIPKVMIFLDSIGNLGTLKELTDAESGSTKEDMTRAKRIKSLFRILMTRMAEVKIPFIYSNHVYKTTDFMAAWVGSGGSGREYGASIILMLTKAKLKDKKKEDQIGIILTAKPNKNRFAKPNVVKTHLDYKTGLNRFTGLQDFIDFGWEDNGIEKGTIITEKELKKKSPGIRAKAVEFTQLNAETNENEILYFCPDKNSSTVAVKELGRHLTSKEFFSEVFFTENRLKQIDELVKPLFNYGIDEDLPDSELFDISDAEADLDIYNNDL